MMDNTAAKSHNRCDSGNLTAPDDENGKIEHVELEIIIMTIYIVIGFVGNIFVIVIYSGSNQEKTRTYKQFIIILAAIDLISCLVFATLNFSAAIDLKYITFDVVCKIIRYLCHTTATLSALTVTLIGIQRFTLICRPLQHPYSSSSRNCRVAVCACFAAVISIPYLVFYGHSEEQKCNHIKTVTCGLLKTFAGSDFLFSYNIFLTFLTAVVIVTIVTLYLAILRTAKGRLKMAGRNAKHEKTDIRVVASQHINRIFFADKENSSSNNQTMNTHINQSMLSLNVTLCQAMSSPAKPAKREKAKKRNNAAYKAFRQHVLTCMFFTITMLCIVTYIPRRIIDLLGSMDFDIEHFAKKHYGYRFLKNLYILHSVLNPYIYGLFDRDLRRRLRGFFKRLTRHNE